VTNPGLDTNWCGHHFSQSNWYAFGRLAWNPELSAEKIADEWTRMTFTHDEKTVAVIRDMMMGSRETFVNYTMPLGLHHMIAAITTRHSHGMIVQRNPTGRQPIIIRLRRRASDSIERSRRPTAVEQYFPPVCDMFDDLKTCPEKYLLWFHRCAWDYQMKSGKSLWDELCAKYQAGTKQAVALQTAWQSLAGKVDRAGTRKWPTAWPFRSLTRRNGATNFGILRRLQQTSNPPSS